MTKAELYKKACMLPLLPGVYIIRDKTDTIIYIGKAKRLKIRVSQYFREGVPHDAKVTQMINHAFTFDVIVCQSEFEALVLEASQIRPTRPSTTSCSRMTKATAMSRSPAAPGPVFRRLCRKMTTMPITSARSHPPSPCGRWWRWRRIAFCCPAAARSSRGTSAKAAPA